MRALSRIAFAACITSLLTLLGTAATFAADGDDLLLLTDGITEGEATMRSARHARPEVDLPTTQQLRLGGSSVVDWLSAAENLTLCCICPAPPAVVKLTLTKPFNYPCKPAPNPYVINRGGNNTITIMGTAKGYGKKSKVKITINYPGKAGACSVVGPTKFPINCCTGAFGADFQNAAGGQGYDGAMTLQVLDSNCNQVGCIVSINVHTN